MTTGERIREARMRAGLTQADLARKLGISYQSIGQWERNGRNPKYETMQKIAEALGLTMNDLFEIPKSLPGLIDSAYMDNEENITNVNEIYRQEKLMEYFSLLNRDGQEKAVERVEELTEIPKYQKDPPPEDSGNG